MTCLCVCVCTAKTAAAPARSHAAMVNTTTWLRLHATGCECRRSCVSLRGTNRRHIGVLKTGQRAFGPSALSERCDGLCVEACMHRGQCALWLCINIDGVPRRYSIQVERSRGVPGFVLASYSRVNAFVSTRAAVAVGGFDACVTAVVSTVARC